MRRDKCRPAGCTAGRGVYRMREPMIPVNKLSTSGIDEHWHKCADEARSVADDMKDEISKQMMLQIADDYERLTKRDVTRLPGRPICFTKLSWPIHLMVLSFPYSSSSSTLRSSPSGTCTELLASTTTASRS